MQFIDEALIRVEAGKGGGGCLSFRREKYVAMGGPDGGNGGDGGDVTLVASSSLNTLIDFRYQPLYKARNGQPGSGQNRTGGFGEAREVNVPVGTTVIDADTLEVLGDLTREGERLLVAKGGHRGYGNAHFKSSTNRAPRRTTVGYPGEARHLKLQLKLLADVGLLGLPNAGKSTLISVVSAARPKIADYPFTTLTPGLGVVRVAEDASFVMADIPGIIAGAAEGAGLGVQFLRHISRTTLLVHLVDVLPDDGSDALENVLTIEAELAAYSQALARRPIWLVLSKVDQMDEDALKALKARLTGQFPGREILAISALGDIGVEDLKNRLMQANVDHRRSMHEDADYREAQFALEQEISADVLASALKRSAGADDEDAQDGSDEDEVEVEYRE